jgi:hypothetical protein
MKKLSVIPAALAAMLLFPGVAHADAISNEINTHANRPGMVQFLTTARTLDGWTSPGEVGSGYFLGGYYCFPVGDPELGGVTTSRQDRQQQIDEFLAEDATSTQLAWHSALSALCSHY